MKHGDAHIIVSAISDKIELTVEPSKGNDLILLTIDNTEGAPMPPEHASIFLNKDHARVLFGLLGQFLHAWER